MCGLIGVINLNINLVTDSSINGLRHRGPDDFGTFKDGKIWLGHTRLSIVDTSPMGHQPMYSNDNNFIIVFNGEIYNHLEIRADLISRGYIFNGTSDTETLLNGYIEFGESILNKLNGIFAFVIYNKLNSSVLIARDQFGVKPLYYLLDNDTLYFSSELKMIFDLKSSKKELDILSLSYYMSFLYSPNSSTPFKHIKKLEAGHFIRYVIDEKKFDLKKYYDVPFNGKYSSSNIDELIIQLDQYLVKAVERQLMSDVPVGFFLSGGVDSSLIAAIAQKLRPDNKIECFTIDYGCGKFNEEGFTSDLYYAELISKHLNFNLTVIDAQVDIVRDFDKMIWHLDEPQADPAPLNVLRICEAARRKGIKVLLGGTGGDDVFSGYRRHQVLNYEKYLSILPTSFWTLLRKSSGCLNVRNPLFRRLRKFLNESDKNKIERMAGYFSWVPYNEIVNLFAKQFRTELSANHPKNELINLLKRIPLENSDLNKMLYWEMKTFLSGHNLNYTDKMSMAVGVEARVPFLDLDLVNFSTNIPPKFKLNGITTKYILKKVAEKYLPDEIIYRPKSGFGAPIRKWITQDLDEMISIRLSPEIIRTRGIFDDIAVWQLIKDNKAGKIDASYTIWSLLAIESWMQQFVDGKNGN